MNIYHALGTREVPARLLLIDGHSALFRSFYAIPELTTSKGEPVNAVYGFVRTLLSALRQYPARYLAVAFDAGGPTVRHREFAAYKATRKEMPDALAQQLPRVKELLDTLGVARLELPGYEADDIMATLARSAERQGLEVLLLTGDKDMAQLVSDKVLLLRPGRKPSEGLTLLDREGVEEKFGVPPEKIVDLLALVGDTSDNVPGVRGIGDKTAKRLLAEFGSLEAILDNVDKVRNKRAAQALMEHREEALLSRELVRLREVELDVTLADLEPAEIDLERLISLLSELEFKSILAELGVRKGPEPRYRVITDQGELEGLVARLREAEEFSLDLETTGKDPFSAQIVGIALALEPYEGFYVPVGHSYLGVPEQLPLETVLEALRPLLEAERPRVIGQNLKYDIEVLARYGIEVRGIAFDAMIAHWLLHPNAPSHSLEAVVRDELGERVQSYKELLAEGGEEGMREVPLARAGRYAAEDAEVVCRLRRPLTEKLKQAQLLPLFEEVEVPLIRVLAWMERRGVLLDPEVLREQGKELEVMLQRLREELFSLAGGPFNPDSVPQVREVLYGRLKLPVIARTKTGPATDAQVLRELSAYHELPGKLIAYRELEKLRNTYIEKLPRCVNPETGRIHTSFNQTGTATGRLSSSEPNLQNIPARHEVGVDIRRAFVAPEGRLLLAADYSQIELRILAHLSGDKGLIEAFRKGEDLHRRTAAQIFGVSQDRVDSRMRTVAKRVNFGIVYGISPYGLARDLGIPQSEAKEFIDRFFAAYPKVREFIDRKVEEATKTGYALTLLGRRRPLPGLASGDKRRQGYERRNAINTPIQGSAADLMKLAMLRLHRLWEEGELRADMILQIHDELIFEVDEPEAAAAAELVREAMEGVWELAVPLKVDVKLGTSWGDL
ncbi:DNA polymerase I [Candidatus Acetothermia bacterium]|nr:MAG: DNA polymerase I [Candidatus Acetothermia bacterium]